MMCDFVGFSCFVYDFIFLFGQKFVLELDTQKAVVMSLNLCSEDIVTHMGSKAEVRKLKDRLRVSVVAHITNSSYE